MKRTPFLTFAFFGLILTACSSDNTSFSRNDLNSDIYQGYWAMSPINEQYRVVKFLPNGTVKVYDYTCDHQHQSYTLNQTETIYLHKLKENYFSLLDSNGKPFAQFEILRLTAKQLYAKQYFDQEQPLFLNYINRQGATPNCG